MKSLIIYSSQTGNTYKLAKAFCDAVPGEKQLYSIQSHPESSNYDLVVMAFWVKGGKPDPAAAQFLPKIGAKPLFLLATHGAAKGSDHAKQAIEAAKALAPQAKIVGTYNCQGTVASTVLEMASSKPEPPVWLADAPAAVGHPDHSEIDEVKALAAKVSLS